MLCSAVSPGISSLLPDSQAGQLSETTTAIKNTWCSVKETPSVLLHSHTSLTLEETMEEYFQVALTWRNQISHSREVKILQLCYVLQKSWRTHKYNSCQPNIWYFCSLNLAITIMRCLFLVLKLCTIIKEIWSKWPGPKIIVVKCSRNVIHIW